MVEKQIGKIVTMATNTELVGEPAMGSSDVYENKSHTDQEHNLNLIRSSLRLRYERDPTFHAGLQKLIQNV